MIVAPLQIGLLKLASNVLLAPMAGYCDLSYRLVVRRLGGVGLAYTDLLCPAGILRENRKSLELTATCPEDAPLAMQLYGSDPALLADAARWAEDHGAAVVDINMGCPVDRITAKSGGSGLLCDIPLALKVAEAVARALRHAPLTAKLRLGWDDQHIVAPELARQLEEVGIAAIAVHGRTAVQQFAGAANLDAIAAVVAAVRHIPVIGNGDIREPGDAMRMIEHTACAGVMIGRAAIAAPWLPRDVHAALNGHPALPEPTLQEKCDLMREHFANLLRHRDEHTAIAEFRHRVSWYAKHLHPCRILREKMRFIRTPGDFEAAIEAFLRWRHTRP